MVARSEPRPGRNLQRASSALLTAGALALVAACSTEPSAGSAGGAAADAGDDPAATLEAEGDGTVVDTTTTTTSTTTTTIPPEPLDPPVRLLESGAATDPILFQDYAAESPGPYDEGEFRDDYGNTNSFGIEQGRAAIEQEATPPFIDWGDLEPIDQYLRITHPEGSIGAGRSGVSFQAKFDDHDDVTAEWVVFLEPGWSWGTGDLRGGKLGGLMLGPKLVSGGRQPDGSSSGDGAGGSVRLTWSDDGQMEAYIYHLDQPGDFGDKFTPQMVDGEAAVIDVRDRSRPNGDPVEWDVGRWQAVGLRVKVNTPGQADGEVDVYKDSELVLSVRGLSWRGDNADWGVSGFMHGFFFGGARDSYAPANTSFSRISDITVVDTNAVVAAPN